MLALSNAIVAFIAIFLMERIGRKLLILISFSGMSVVMLFLLIGESLKVSHIGMPNLFRHLYIISKKSKKSSSYLLTTLILYVPI